jgi:hypothetical protein
MHCHHDEEVVQSLLGPSDSPLVASLNLGAQGEWVLVPFESSLFPGARSILIFDGSLPQDFECSDCSAQLGIQQWQMVALRSFWTFEVSLTATNLARLRRIYQANDQLAQTSHQHIQHRWFVLFLLDVPKPFVLHFIDLHH